MNTTTTNEFTALIVPCHNDQHRLDGNQYIEFLSKYSNFRIIFVDDGSRDRTVELLERIQDAIPDDRIWILQLTQNYGRSEAIRRGVLLAMSTVFLKSIDLSAIGILDTGRVGSLNEALGILKSMAEQPDVDLLMTRRRLQRGHSVEPSFLLRIFDKALSLVAVRALALPASDVRCQVAFMRYGRWLELVFCRKFSHRTDCDLEVLARLQSEFSMVARSMVAEFSTESLELNDVPHQTYWGQLRKSWQLIRLIFEHRVWRHAIPVAFDEHESSQGLAMPIAFRPHGHLDRPRIFIPSDSEEDAGDSSETSELVKIHRDAA